MIAVISNAYYIMCVSRKFPLLITNRVNTFGYKFESRYRQINYSYTNCICWQSHIIKFFLTIVWKIFFTLWFFNINTIISFIFVCKNCFVLMTTSMVKKWIKISLAWIKRLPTPKYNFLYFILSYILIVCQPRLEYLRLKWKHR